MQRRIATHGDWTIYWSDDHGYHAERTGSLPTPYYYALPTLVDAIRACVFA